MVAHPGGNSLLPPWGLCPAVPSDGAPREPLVVLVGVKTRTLGRSWQCLCPSLLQLQFCLPGAPLAPEGKLHSMAFKTVPESFCFLQGLPNFLSPKQTSGLTYELRVSCILKGQKSLFSFKNPFWAMEQASLPGQRDCQSAMSTVPSTFLDNRFLAVR